MKSIIVIVVAVLIGLSVSIAGSQNGANFGSIPLFLFCGILAYAVNWLAFVPANIFKTEKYYDLTGSFTYLTVIAIACVFASPLDLRASVVAAMVAIWALRLGSFLFRRISADGKDSRFDSIKTDSLRFLQAWTLQGTWVVLTAASALLIITTTQRVPIGIFFVIGALCWIVGFAIEVAADRQKSAFRSKPENKGRFIKTGLWAWSRHPNYFGEILLWTGITIISLPLLNSWQWATLISPIFVWFLLTKVSGVPMLERSADKKWGDDPEYVKYRDQTPLLVPKPPKK